MQFSTLVLTLLVLMAVAYQVGRRRSLAVAHGSPRQLHSLPSYYGYLTALWAGIPALLVLGIWTFFEHTIVTQLVVAGLPEEIRSLPPNRLTLVVNDLKNLVSGNIVSGEVSAVMQAAADHYRHLLGLSRAAVTALVLSLGAGGATLFLHLFN